MSRNHLIAGLVLAPLLAQAAEFPDGATVPSAEELRQHLGDKIFNLAMTNGGTMRVDYKSNGYFFVNTSSRFQGKGQWRAENGRLCTQLQDAAENCNDVRLANDQLVLKRVDGEIVPLVPR